MGEWRCRNSVAIALSDGGDTAMRVLGQEALAFTGVAGYPYPYPPTRNCLGVDAPFPSTRP